MGAEIQIYCPAGSGPTRSDLEDQLEGFFEEAAEMVGGMSGAAGFKLDFELGNNEDVEQWVVRIRDFLRQQKVRHGTYFNVVPPDWEPGTECRRVEVYEE